MVGIMFGEGVLVKVFWLSSILTTVWTYSRQPCSPLANVSDAVSLVVKVDRVGRVGILKVKCNLSFQLQLDAHLFCGGGMVQLDK